MRVTLTNDIDRAKYDFLVRKHGYKAANDWVRREVALYDVFEAPKSEKQDPLTITTGSGKFLMRATMRTIERMLDLHPDAVNRILNEIDQIKLSFVFHSRGRMVGFFHGICPSGGSITRPDGTAYVPITDLKRLHEAAFVLAKLPDEKEFAFDGRLLEIALDAGPHVWVHASYAERLPEGAVQVGDGRSPGYSQDGNRIVSIPAEWCTFYTASEAEGIQMCMDADDALLAQARG